MLGLLFSNILELIIGLTGFLICCAASPFSERTLLIVLYLVVVLEAFAGAMFFTLHFQIIRKVFISFFMLFLS